MILPSKELLLAIGIHEAYVNSISIEGSNVLFHSNKYGEDFINIYELMHMMKEWVAGQGYSLNSGIATYKNQGFCSCSGKLFWEDSEVEAVTKACEWILKQNL